MWCSDHDRESTRTFIQTPASRSSLERSMAATAARISSSPEFAVLDGYVRLAPDSLHGLATSAVQEEGGLEPFVLHGDGVERPLQPGDLERAPQPSGQGDIVRALVLQIDAQEVES